MKRLRAILAGLGIVLLAAALLLWFLPARWVLPFAEARLGVRLEGVGGLLWDGHAERVLGPDGTDLGRVAWRLSRRALFGGIHLDLDTDGTHGSFSGHVKRRRGGLVEWRGVKLRVDAASLAARLPAQPWQAGGVLNLRVGHARLQGAWPIQLDASARWLDASAYTRDGELALGQWQLEAHGEDGAILGRLADDGSGPLQVLGELRLSPLGWRFAATFTPRRADPALRRWLATLGRPDADGSLHLVYSGGLAAFSSTFHL